MRHDQRGARAPRGAASAPWAAAVRRGAASALRAAAVALLGLGAPLVAPVPAGAQSASEAGTAYIQIQAVRSRAEGLLAAAENARRVAGVQGFAAPGGWYVIALGPFTPDAARERLARLRAEGRIPADSFVADPPRYRARFWPEAGAPAPGTPAQSTPAPDASEPDTPVAEAPAADLPEETEREARASEGLLSRPERDALQVALQWAGFYDGAIDGAFGRGTRGAMSGWQAARGLPATGVLTTRQRAQLLAEYDAVLDGLEMAMVTDRAAGIAMEMPTALVRAAGRETPFARYEPRAGAEIPEARVLLISREGDADDLAGLYEIVQTLEAVPPEGPRERSGDAFEIEGRGERLVTRLFAEHADGRIKGAALVWPAGDEDRAARVWQRMRLSFDPSLPGVLGAREATPADAQDVDLLAGLEIRRPDLVRSGFFVGEGGAVLTTAEIAEAGCRAIRLGDVHEARIAWSDGRVALLDPAETLAPAATALFRAGPARIGADVAVAGFPWGGALGRASVSFGRLADVKGLGGEAELDRYEVAARASEAGAPVLDGAGAVAGMLLPAGRARALPESAALGLDAGALRAALEAEGVEAPLAPGGAPVPPETLTAHAGDLAVLVACYR